MNEDTRELLREALRQEESERAGSLGDDQPITEMIIQNFRGRRLWLTLFPIGLSLLYTGLGVWCGYKFFQAEATRSQLAWMAGFLVFAMSVGLTKIWIWGEWNRYSLIREIKRLELAIVDIKKRGD